MKFLSRLDRYIKALNLFFFKVGAFFTFCLIIFTLTSVLARYLFQTSFVWFDELLWHFFGLGFLLAMAHTLNEDGHVRVDILYNKFSHKTKAWVEILGIIFFMFPICYLIIRYGYSYSYASYEINEISDSPNGMPYRWLIKGAIPFGFILLTLQGVSHIIKQIFILTNKVEIKE
jgi:TRAP-type mannitol/chloroaromatic compound transport system permease small subunit